MERNDLISYALSFVAFILRDKAISEKITKAILFGSVARGDFDSESDIDLFIESGIHDKLIQKQLDLFNKSKIKDIYNLKGIENDIVLKVGKLDKWKGLKESIIDDGILLYGKYEEAPKELKHFTLFKISIKKKAVSAKLKIWRNLYGHKQRVGKKLYTTKGFLQELGCTKLSKGIFFVPLHQRQKIIDFLDKNKVSYEMLDVYRK